MKPYTPTTNERRGWVESPTNTEVADGGADAETAAKARDDREGEEGGQGQGEGEGQVMREEPEGEGAAGSAAGSISSTPASPTDAAEIKVGEGRVPPLVDGLNAEEGVGAAELGEGEALDFTMEKNGPPRHQHGDGGGSGAKGGEGGEGGVDASAQRVVADQSNPWLVKNMSKGGAEGAPDGPNEPVPVFNLPDPISDEPEGLGDDKGEVGEGAEVQDGGVSGGERGGDSGGGSGQTRGQAEAKTDGETEGGLGAEATDELSSMPRSKRKVEMIISDEVEVDVWLGAISPHLIQYSSSFRDLGYDTTEFLLELDEEDRADLLKVRAFKLWNDRPCPS